MWRPHIFKNVGFKLEFNKPQLRVKTPLMIKVGNTQFEL